MERLQKVLARAGIASRRRCEEFIEAGRVRVNGVVVTLLGTKVDPQRDRIEFDGVPITLPEETIVLALHKPKGYLTTVRDPQRRRTVLELLPPLPQRVFPVGRLDKDSEGLLLFTNDGALADQLSHPRYQHEKEYLVLLRERSSAEAIEELRQGVMLEDGPTAPALVELVSPNLPWEEASGVKGWWVRMMMHEGRKRQIRRMWEHAGHSVLRLIRVRIGPISLGGLAPGHWRRLTPRQVAELRTYCLARRKGPG